MSKFREIFEGNKSAYGQLVLSGTSSEKGKAEGKAFVKKQEVTDELFTNHLEGAVNPSTNQPYPALGIIPINEQNECKWGCIDVDEYNFKHKEAVENIKEKGFPLIVFRSKSGGAHLFLFTKEFIPASRMIASLEAMSDVLGYSGCEIFPKQTEISVEKGDVGNFLNLPYYKGTKGLRYALSEEGSAMKVEEFYEVYDKKVQTLDQLLDLKPEKKPKVKKKPEIFRDGPHCLNRLAEEGFGEGSRNNSLFNLAIYRQKANPDNWQDLVEEDNHNYMNPPLKSTEVATLLKSVGKKGYDKYRCKDQPICNVCDASKCRTKRFGVGYEEEKMPELSGLSKITSDPPQWFLTVADQRVELKTVELNNPILFQIAVLDKCSISTPELKGPEWRKFYLDPLLADIQEIEPLESLDPINQITNLLYDFTVNRPQARTKEDILNKTAWTDDGHTYFRLDDFYNFAKRSNWELDKTKTGNMLKQLDFFEKEERMQLKNQTPRLIKIKAMKKTEPSVSKATYKERPF